MCPWIYCSTHTSMNPNTSLSDIVLDRIVRRRKYPKLNQKAIHLWRGDTFSPLQHFYVKLFSAQCRTPDLFLWAQNTWTWTNGKTTFQSSCPYNILIFLETQIVHGSLKIEKKMFNQQSYRIRGLKVPPKAPLNLTDNELLMFLVVDPYLGTRDDEVLMNRN